MPSTTITMHISWPCNLAVCAFKSRWTRFWHCVLHLQLILRPTGLQWNFVNRSHRNNDSQSCPWTIPSATRRKFYGRNRVLMAFEESNLQPLCVRLSGKGASSGTQIRKVRARRCSRDSRSMWLVLNQCLHLEEAPAWMTARKNSQNARLQVFSDCDTFQLSAHKDGNWWQQIRRHMKRTNWS